jgi:threonine dehydrogenase-like Zn-dependent dehydrogenase
VGEGVDAPGPGTRVACLSSRAFAEYDIAPAACTVPLPPALEGRAFPGEALGCAFNVMRRAAVTPGSTVAVVGVGFLGAVITRLAVQAGARVIAVSRRPFALDVARAHGAGDTVALEDAAAAVAQVLALAPNGGCDCAIEVAGAQLTLDVASGVVAERGRLVVAGYHQDGPRQVDMQSWNWRGIDVINAHERDPRTYVEGMRAAVEAVVRDGWDLDALFTHRFGLGELHRALHLMESRPDGFVKALVLT